MERVKQAKMGVFSCFGKIRKRYVSGIVQPVRPLMEKQREGIANRPVKRMFSTLEGVRVCVKGKLGKNCAYQHMHKQTS